MRWPRCWSRARSGTLVGGRLVDRIGRRSVLVGSIVAQIPLLLAFMLAPSELVAGVLLAAIGFVTVMSFSVSVVMGQEYLPSRLGLASGRDARAGDRHGRRRRGAARACWPTPRAWRP